MRFNDVRDSQAIDVLVSVLTKFKLEFLHCCDAPILSEVPRGDQRDPQVTPQSEITI